MHRGTDGKKHENCYINYNDMLEEQYVILSWSTLLNIIVADFVFIQEHRRTCINLENYAYAILKVFDHYGF